MREKSPLEGKESGDSQLTGVKREASSSGEAKIEMKKKKVETSVAWTTLLFGIKRGSVRQEQ